MILACLKGREKEGELMAGISSVKLEKRPYFKVIKELKLDGNNEQIDTKVTC